ncbi:MAG: PEP/pyruvate-binding domain-containing protein [Candidatus Moranbacteria bacterium]|nr:PEP/pyruvate-binding domain-containing protein [Candidatus Moranbacteria bacterium]
MIYKLSTDQKNATSEEVGGKAYPLLQLVSSGIPVPEGFVISSQEYRKFLERNNLIEKINNFSGKHGIDPNNLREIRDLIEKGTFDKRIIKGVEDFLSGHESKYFSIRSSADVEDAQKSSFAGKFESYLGVEKDAVLDYAKKCYASVFTDRVASYADPEKLKDINMAVIIQELLDSEVSGVCFTANPLDADSDAIIIEAIYGIGEYLVQGSVKPDNYIIEKETVIPLEVEFNAQPRKMVLSEKNGGLCLKNNPCENEQKLSGEKMAELSKIAKKIEKIQGKNRDIEWAFSDDKFFILQSRPIVFNK